MRSAASLDPLEWAAMLAGRWVLLLLFLGVAAAQEAPANGPRRVDPGWHAIVGATVHVAPGHVLEHATVVIRDGLIESVSTDAPPAGARVWRSDRLLDVYAGFIEPHVPVEVTTKGAHWNPKVTPERVARAIGNDTAENLRKLGFTAAVAAPKSGILRGRGTLVALAPNNPDRSVPRPTVYRDDVYQALGFDRFKDSKDGYPTSQMGAIAVIRQSLHDRLLGEAPLLFDTEDELEALRAGKVAREFERTAILLGSGLEFRRLDAIAADGLPVLVPVRFPPPPDVSSVGAADAVDLRELMTWEQAPTNLRRLDAAGVRVALTTSKLQKDDDFLANVREAIRHGLAPDRALAMLTTQPAEILGVADRLGTVEKGKAANLVVTDGTLFDVTANSMPTKLRAVWIDGKRFELAPPAERVAGGWEILCTPDVLGKVRLDIEYDLKATLQWEGEKEKVKPKSSEIDAETIRLVFEHGDGLVTLSGVVGERELTGDGVAADGTRFHWFARPVRKAEEGEESDLPEPDVPETYGYPFGPYALAKLPAQEHVTFFNATVWTCGPQGIVEHGEVEIDGGKIVYAGPARDGGGGGRRVDLQGKHVTPGIIDCHSHTGISKGINDSGQAVTAEVRIGDVTNPDSISWYRQLAGGVTTVNSLHGSANPIGGQSQTNKIRWGVRRPDAMHFEGAKPGIKFALGENVKQSNWGDEYKTRYPQTRMGVETLIRDRLTAAREYLKGHDKVDLELEALGEVLKGERLVHCHSYRQDEILMLCRVAQDFGFEIGTFQHVLEGYKVAEAIKAHAIGASSFSDWWAYKVEVQDAIPFNGALMHDVGVVVTFNSDSDELARHLNVEAAKAMRYGGVPRAEAFQFVTLNAAIQLGIAGRVGSLEAGKDADLAIWSGDPMSTFTRCEATWVDGRNYFSLEQDAAHRAHIAKERHRIIAKLLKLEVSGKKGKRGGAGADQPHWWISRFEAYDCGDCGRAVEAGR